MRLIDADKLKTSLNETVDAAIKWHEDCLGEIMQNRSEAAITAFVECILRVKEQPTVDAVEIIRCRDCKHYLRNKIYVIDGVAIRRVKERAVDASRRQSLCRRRL